MRVFSLKDFMVRSVRQEHGLDKAKLIGSGTFACVFDDGDPDTVLKLTADEFSYMYLSDGTAPSKDHAPAIIDDIGYVGDTQYDLPLYLTRIERLRPLQAGSPAKKLARALIKQFYSERRRNFTSRFSAGFFQHIEVPDSVRNFLLELEQFISNAGGGVDFHGSNFMERPDGTLVFNDPVANFKLIASYHRKRISARDARWMN